MKVFVLLANGDDYHGTFVVGVYATQEAAQTAKTELESQQCDECGHSYHGSITEHEV